MPYTFIEFPVSLLKTALPINTVLFIMCLIAVELSPDDDRTARQRMLMPYLVLFSLLMVAAALYQMNGFLL